MTIPIAVRDAMEIKPGDTVVFQVRDGEASLRRVPNFLELAGSVPVPPELRGLSLDELIKVEREASSRAALERHHRSLKHASSD